jgi:hypothetical protein
MTTPDANVAEVDPGLARLIEEAKTVGCAFVAMPDPNHPEPTIPIEDS